MARNRITSQASPERVFAVLADPRRYAYFVVGTRRIRRFDPRWPEPGSMFHHSLGVGVTAIRDTTQSTAVDPPRRLVVQPRMRPLAVNESVFVLTHTDGQTVIEVEETAVAGPATHKVVAPIVDRLLALRNALLLRRLCKVAEARESMAKVQRVRRKT